ncbi:MAG: B12-binding domain-containing radical SAM protein [Candidatus Glassbacteria bacterium]
MKVTFVYADYDDLDPKWFKIWKVKKYTGNMHFGIAILSACLKREGHETSFIHISQKYGREKYQEELMRHSPDLLAITCMSAMYPYMKKIAAWSKEKMKTPIICGGPHPTLLPRETLLTDGIDIICRGEGEYALMELCDRLERDKDYSDVKSLWIKRNGEIMENQIRPMVEDLDELPDFDFDLFDVDNLHSILVAGNAYVMASRGCPYNCTYCCNHRFRKLYPNYQKYVRYRGARRVVDELKRLKENHPRIEQFRFWDDILTLRKDWSREFLPMYKEEVGLPFHCYGKIDMLDDERIHLMKDAGCIMMSLGIQSGNPEVRKEILNRSMSNKKIFHVCNKIHEYGIAILTENILGLPLEDKWKILDTIKVNARINPENMFVFMFQPFKNTDIYEICKAKGLIPGEEEISKLGINLWDGPYLKMPYIEPERVRFYQNFFQPIMEVYGLGYRNAPGTIPLLDAFFTWEYLPLKMLNRLYHRHIAHRLNYNYKRVVFPRRHKLPLYFMSLALGALVFAYRHIAGLFRTQPVLGEAR